MRRVWLTGTAIFVAALSVRLIYLIQLRDTPFYDNLRLILDSRYYDMEARRIASGDWIGDFPYYLGPLYSHVLGVIYVLFERSFHAAKVFQCVLGAFSCVLLYGIGRRVFNETIGLIAAGIFSFYAPMIFHHGLLLPTSLEVFVNLLFLYVLTRGSPTPTVGRCLVAGLCLGLAAIAKGNALMLLPALILYWALGGSAGRWKDRLLWSLSLAAGALVTISPVTIRNYAVSGEFVLLTTTGGRNFLKGNGPTATGTHAYLPGGQRGTDLSDYLSRRKKIDPHKVVVESRAMAAAAWKYMAEHPVDTATLWWRKFVLFFNACELGNRDQYYFAKRDAPLLQLPLPSFETVAPIGLIGLVMAWPWRKTCGILYVMLAVQVISFVSIFVLGRYRMPAVAVLTLFAGYQLFWWANAIRERRWGMLAVSLALAAAFAVFVNWPLADFPKDRGFAVQYELVGNYRHAHAEYEAALEAYESALTSDWQDENPVAKRKKCWKRMASCHLKLGRPDEARVALERFIEELENADPRRNHATIEELRGMIQDIEAGGGTVIGDDDDPDEMEGEDREP